MKTKRKPENSLSEKEMIKIEEGKLEKRRIALHMKFIKNHLDKFNKIERRLHSLGKDLVKRKSSLVKQISFLNRKLKESNKENLNVKKEKIELVDALKKVKLKIKAEKLNFFNWEKKLKK
ncbi:MAG: hypothetical protein ABFQ65_04480 [Nanoarchaeota archaeon]